MAPDENSHLTIEATLATAVSEKTKSQSPQVDSQQFFAWKAHVENADEWVRSRIFETHLTIQPNRTFLSPQGAVKASEVLRDIKIQYDLDFKKCFNAAVEGDYPWPQRIGSDILALSFAKLVDLQWAADLKKKVLELKHDPAIDLSELGRFIEACTGKRRDLDIYVLAHWLWQVKRKMISQDVTNHIMPILIGSQGSGKSTAVEKLMSCVRDYRSDLSIGALGDERNYHSLEESFVIVCDEMQGCDRTDVDRLKNVITATSTTARRLYTNTRDRIQQNASLIGTSNKMVELLIRDDTGLRRFHVVPCSDRMSWETLNSIDYLQIWRGIDESRAGGYVPVVLGELKVEQEANRVATPVEDYLRETGAIPTAGDPTRSVSINDLFSDYCKWCEGAKVRPLDRGWFWKHLKPLGVSLRRTSKQRLADVSASFIPWALSQVTDLVESGRVSG